ncbi:MAG: carbamoyltransferase HypF [Sulfurimonadaceae bacterium]
MIQRVVIDVSGIVQGVGFRPFVYILAKELNLNGTVLNNGDGVHIEIEGEKHNIDRFLERLYLDKPALAKINDIKKSFDTPQGEKSFTILESAQGQKRTLVSPDMSICDACLAELFDPDDRRYRYFASNCTHCGPRYSIIETLPYDRALTSMKAFTMCPVCAEEYKNPLDRRYHAQPVSCHGCGPTLKLYDNENREVSCSDSDPILKVSQLFEQGAIVAVKGLGGFHLMCDGESEKSVALLRQRKNRPLKPLALLFPTMQMIAESTLLSTDEKEMIESKERPIVLVYKKAESVIASNVAPGIDRIGVMLPYTPLQFLIFDAFKRPLVATSANISNEPIIRTKDELMYKLGDVVDYVLDFNREIVNAVDDSVLQMVDDRPIFLRLGRGFTPKSFTLPFTLPFTLSKNILAVGGEQKNTLALAFHNQVVVSPHIGDLTSIEAFEFFERTLQTFQRFYDFTPDLIVCDRHPEYATSRWAKEQGVPVVEVQHHHAHILSVMLEQQIKGDVLGVAFDGTGYGEGKSIWGGEFLHCDSGTAFERVAHFKPLTLLGGHKAIKEPRRIALAMAFEVMDLNAVEKSKIAEWFTPKELTLLHKAYENSINVIKTSSLGRVFDGVASLLGIVHKLSYEGESGLKMEQYYDESIESVYPFEYSSGVISLDQMIVDLLDEEDKRRGVSMFFNTVVDVIVFMAQEHRVPLVLSGGVFQNRVLVTLLFRRLEEECIEYYFPKTISPNDSAIALGQIEYAIRLLHL